MSLAPERLLMIDLSGSRLTPDERAFLGEHAVGGVCLFVRNIEDRFQVADLTAELRDLCGSTLIVATDQEGGGVVRSLDVPYPPSAMALGAAADLELTAAVAAATARGLRAQGITLDFAPVADVNSNPRNAVIADRSFGEDPVRVAAQVAAFVQGLQREGVAACVKHFPGHGDTETDSHLGLPVQETGLERLEQLEFVPFRKALEAGVAGVMSAHIVVRQLDPERPATLSRRVLTDLLRGQLGFSGVIFTDALNMRAIADRFSPEGAVLGALAAGVDMPLHVGPLTEHQKIVTAFYRALDDETLERVSLEASLERLAALAQRYPARAEPKRAWQEGDEALLLGAARRALVRVGQPRLEGPLLLVAADQVHASAASQATVSPVHRLAEILTQLGTPTTLLTYDRDELAATQTALLEKASHASGTVVFVSTARTRMGDDERNFAQAVAQRARGFVHLALWNPYHAKDLPGPALLTFGFREASLQAVAASWDEANATSPVKLELLPPT